MRTWDEFVEQVMEEGGIPKEILELSETTAQITVAMCEAREKLGISQRELARLSGLCQSVIARFEIGETSPRLDTLVKMLSPLGLKLQAVGSELDFQLGITTTIVVDTLSIARATGKLNMDWENSEFKEVSIHV